MPDLKMQWEGWDCLLLGPESEIEKAATTLGLQIKEARLYRQLVGGHLIEVMDKMYPRCKKMLGESRFASLTQQYYASFPPEHWELNQVSKHFPSFLKNHVKEDTLVAELASYEWVEFEVFMHDSLDRPLMGVDHVMGMNASLRVEAFPVGLSAIVEKIDKQEPVEFPPDGLPPTLEYVLFLRDPLTHRCRMAGLSLMGRWVLAQAVEEEAMGKSFRQLQDGLQAKAQREALFASLSPKQTETRLSQTMEVFSQMHVWVSGPPKGPSDPWVANPASIEV